MNYADVETFLELARTRNITKASEHLYLSQSTVSNRLKNLENELGFALIIRSKGRRALELTRRGEEFIALAERWRALYQETEALRDTAFSKISVAANESTYYTKVMPFLLQYGREHRELRFSVRICDSEQIYDLLDKGLADFGFASYEAEYPKLLVEEIDRQGLCLIASADVQGPDGELDYRKLDPLKEIRFSGGHFASMEQWREAHLPGAEDAALTINAGLGTLQYFEQEGLWAISPVDMARFLARRSQLRLYPLPEQPDPWRVYLVRRRDVDPGRQELFRSFTGSLMEFLSRENEKKGQDDESV
ncbi:MAG: LysR family transcriptional regulator [Oscillospiraceae bacterium]|nr:LysR family transcriptional regulator [Oscillospiraceae bacterium]